MPSLVKLYREFENTDFVILAIDVQEKRDIVKRYAENENLPFPVLLDTKGWVAHDYGIRGHPAHFLVNRKGELIASAMGARKWTSKKNRTLIRFLLDQNRS
jgi:peroxiredoxin